MVMSLTFNGRLPGVVCQAALPPRAEAPLRLDVAGFVGFAERGPCDRPVALEDISQYRAVFGGDLPVAREGGRPVYAALPGAVRAFFDNGGRRCYVVRVTGDGAWATRFRLPGLVSWRGGEEFATPIATAASVGRWSERLSVGTQLSRWPLRALDYRPAARELDLEVPAPTTVRPGDLLRLRLAGAGGETVHFFPVASVQVRGSAATTVRGLPITVRAGEGTVQAFATAADPGSPPAVPVAATRLGETGWELDPLPVPLGFGPLPAKAGGGYALVLPDTERARPGDLLRVTFSGGEVVLFPVAAAGPAGDAG